MPTMNIQISLKFHAVCAASKVAKLQRFETERDIRRVCTLYIVYIVILEKNVNFAGNIVLILIKMHKFLTIYSYCNMILLYMRGT